MDCPCDTLHYECIIQGPKSLGTHSETHLGEAVGQVVFKICWHVWKGEMVLLVRRKSSLNVRWFSVQVTIQGPWFETSAGVSLETLLSSPRQTGGCGGSIHNPALPNNASEESLSFSCVVVSSLFQGWHLRCGHLAC